MLEDLKLRGDVLASITHEDGSVETREFRNLILASGFDFIADSIGKSVGRPSVMSYIAIGAGNAAPVAGNTGLGAEYVRQPATYSHVAGTLTFDMSANFPAGQGVGAITEVGVCNANAGGTFLNRAVFPVINKLAGDAIMFQITFTLANGA